MTERVPAGIREAAMALPNLAKLLVRMMRDGRVPVRRKLLAGAAAGYAVMPIDIIPDAIPLLGQVDDLIVVALGLKHLLDSVDPQVVEEHWDGSGDVFEVISTVLDWTSSLAPGPLRRVVERLAGPADSDSALADQG